MMSPGALPATLGHIWIGETCPPPELLAECFAMSKLDDEEDNFPTQTRQTLMSNSSDDRDTNPASAEPPSEGVTRAENPIPRDAMNPPPQGDSMYDKLVAVGTDILAAHAEQKKIHQDLSDSEGAMARLQRNIVASELERALANFAGLVDTMKVAVLEAIGKVDKASKDRDDELVKQIADLRKQLADTRAQMTADKTELEGKLEAQRQDYEKRFAGQQLCLDTIEKLIPEYEKAIADARAAASKAAETPGQQA